MRANVPTDGAFSIDEFSNTTADEPALTDEQKKLAAIGATAAWKKISKKALKVVDRVEKELFDADISDRSNEEIGLMFLVAQSISSEFKNFVDEVDITTASVREAVSSEDMKVIRVDWKIITEYLDSRIERYKRGLFGEDLAGKDTAIVGQRFVAARQVIERFKEIRQEIENQKQPG